MSDKALYGSNPEVIPPGVANGFLKRTALNDGWQFVAGSLLQTQFVEQTTNTTTGSASFGDLGAVTLTFSTVAGSALLIHFTVSASNSANQTVAFQLVIDGTPVRGLSMRCTNANIAESGALIYKKTGLAAGPHTIKIQWLTSGGTARVAPVTTINEHASLLCKEVSV